MARLNVMRRMLVLSVSLEEWSDAEQGDQVAFGALLDDMEAAIAAGAAYAAGLLNRKHRAIRFQTEVKT